MTARRSPSVWGSLGAVLHAVAHTPPPPWVSESTVSAVRLALVALSGDARAALEGRTTREAPGVSGLARSAYQRALADGWLSGELKGSE